jgi:alkylation response protein AidB-like acyl-CoA dehydrogenase
MNFDLNDEQRMLKDAVERLLADRYGFEARRAVGQTTKGWSDETWGQFAEQGLLAAPFSEDDGGIGGGPIETLVIGEALGAALVAEPYLASVVMGGAALRLGDPAIRAELAPRVAAGETVLAFAEDGVCTAALHGEGWRLTGSKRNVVHGGSADRLVVVADAGVFVVEADDVQRRGYRTFDGLRAAEITLQDTPAQALALGVDALDLAERVRQHAIAYMAAEATGLMTMLLDTTVEHLKTRKQFGKPLSTFQALQHRAAEMLVEIEQARSMAIYAAMMVDDPDAQERRKAFAAIKSVIGKTGRFVGHNAVQLHGGLGVTEEHRAGWGLRRLMMIDMMFGDSDKQNAELARLGGFTPAEAGVGRD